MKPIRFFPVTMTLACVVGAAALTGCAAEEEASSADGALSNGADSEAVRAEEDLVGSWRLESKSSHLAIGIAPRERSGGEPKIAQRYTEFELSPGLAATQEEKLYFVTARRYDARACIAAEQSGQSASCTKQLVTVRGTFTVEAATKTITMTFDERAAEEPGDAPLEASFGYGVEEKERLALTGENGTLTFVFVPRPTTPSETPSTGWLGAP